MLILLHESGWYGQQFDALLPVLTHHADVLAPDLCGHGPHANAGGDLDYIGQLEDDIADLIDLYSRSGQKIVLAGHCSGGGLAIRSMASGWHQRSYLRPYLSIMRRPCAPMLVAGVGAADHRVVAAEQHRCDRVKPSYGIAVCLPGFCLQSDFKTALIRAYSYCLT